MSKKSKHKKHEHCNGCGGCNNRKQVAIPVEAVIEKVNEELRNGRLVIGASRDGVSELQIGTVDEGNNVNVFEGDTEHEFESELNTILFTLGQELYDINTTLNNINFSIDKMREENERRYNPTELHVAQAAEPIKIFPDDSIVAMVKDLVRDTLGQMADDGSVSVICHGCDGEVGLTQPYEPTDDEEYEDEEYEEEDNLLEKVDTTDAVLELSGKEKFNIETLEKLVDILMREDLDKVSTKMIHERIGISYDKARDIMKLLDDNGFVSPQKKGSKLGRTIYRDKVQDYILTKKGLKKNKLFDSIPD